MSRSWRTDRPRAQAKARMAADRDGWLLLPRIVTQKPRPGDVHPLTASMLKTLLRYVPPPYRHGLRAIELRARAGAFVGHPYASYDVRHKIIRLFSVPADRWPLPSSAGEFAWNVPFGARLERIDGIEHLAWQHPRDAARFLYGRVLMHELGHHVMHQYKHKRQLPGTGRRHELGAEMHVERLRGWRVFNTVYPPPDDGEG